MNDAMNDYIRKPNVSFAEQEAIRLDTVGDMLERLRRLACQRLPHAVLAPSVMARFGSYGWEITVFNPLGRDKDFAAGTLSAAYAAAMAWASRDEVAEGYLTLGLDETGARIVEAV